jgi:integrase/recombinase XerD
MTPLRQHMIAALHISGKSERTQASSIREVRLLAQCYHKSPDRISAQELQHSFLHRKNVDGLAPTSMRICSSGMRFFSQHVLQRDWATLALLRAQTAHHLPAVLSLEEVRRVLQAATPLQNQVSFTTVSSLGLRLHEALFLQVSDSAGQRLQVHVHRGQGAKDRSVPLPVETLALLRTSWKTHRHPPWVFPATGRHHTHSPTAASPMSRSSVQGAFRNAKQRAGITTMGVAIHTLRHSYAPPLLEAGVPPRLIPRYLGHTQLETTMIYLHLTHTGQEEAYARLNTLLHGLLPCPPSAISSRLLLQHTWSALPTCPPPTARSAALSNTAKADTTATASLSAQVVGGTTASSIRVATAPVPQCPQYTTQQWLAHHLEKPLPGPHFLLPFTVPETLRPFIRSPQRRAYHARFTASSLALQRLAQDERCSGTDLPGFTGVWHTWGRQLPYHPPIHSSVPGGGLSQDRMTWRPSRANFFVPLKALSPISRALFKEEMRHAGWLEHIAPQVWTLPWHVHSQAHPHRHSAFTSLAPSVFRGALSNPRLVSLTDRTVTFTSRQVGRARPRLLRLDALELSRRFLQHVLPDGFMQVRHFGLLHASCALPLATIRLLIGQGQPRAGKPRRSISPPPRVALCPAGGVPMRVVMRLWAANGICADTG